MSTELTQRVAKRAQTKATGKQVAPAGQQPLSQFVQEMRGELARALPQHLTPDRIARIALTELRRVRHLAECTRASFGGALMTCAQLGLEPGGALGEAYLLPFFNKDARVYEVQLVIGYQGMIKLFWQHPLAAGLDAQVVYADDEFTYAYGLDPVLRHVPSMAADRGQPVAYYAVARLKNGGSAFVVLSPGDIEAVRRRSKARDSGPWRTDYDAMAKKTAIRQLFKLLPKSSELAQAVAHDGMVRRDATADGIDAVPDYIEGETVDASDTTGEPSDPASDSPSDTATDAS
ncbi:recombinase RecT [Streptomyces sp. NA04227]|uniref:recombinase RecT n=1 Tax=Streptomyces sp. NA04227 TaxID=2742136 RepID=UPI001C37DE0B|nr:recombinase RecT [Streptomyces sp. NA04227]